MAVSHRVGLRKALRKVLRLMGDKDVRDVLIRELRRLGMSQEEIGKVTGLDRASVSRIEHRKQRKERPRGGRGRA